MRQRNIPDINKVSTLVQTDINLINQPLVYDINKQLPSHLAEQDNVSHLIRSHTDAQLLDFFRQQASFFKGLGSFENVPQHELRKRLLWIEGQIQGLEKRKLIVDGLGHADYYAILSDVQGKLDKQYVINNNYQPKLREAQLKINQLEMEIEELRRTVNQQNFYKTQNEVYEEAFKKVADITKDQRKMRELQKTVNDVVLPLINEYDVKLDTMMKTINNMGRSSTDSKYKLKGQISGLLRNLDKLIRSTGEMTLQNVQKYIAQFLKQLQVSETYQNYQNRKSYKHRYLELEQKFNTTISMLKNKFQSLLQQNPELSNQLDYSVFDLLERDGVNFYSFDRVVTVEVSDPRVRTIHKQVLDEKSKQYLLLFTSQFRHILRVFPLIREHLSAQMLEILDLEIFQDAIDVEQINRIFEVVKYKPEIIKVQNVYTYNNQAHLKTIFHLKILIKYLLDELFKVKQKTGIVLDIDEGLLNMIKLQIIDYINPDDVLKVFRTLPKILEVEKIVERNLSRYNGVLTEGHPIIVESVKVAESVIEKPVVLKEQVGVIVEKGIPLVAIHEKPIELIVDRIIEVPVEKEVMVERVVMDQRLIEVDVLKQCPIIKQQIKQVQVRVTQEIIVEVPQIVKEQIPVVTRQIIKQIVQVQKFHQRLVEVVKEVTSIKQVKMIEQVPVEITKFMEVEKVINNFVPLPQIIEIKEQVPITVTTTIEKPIEVIETIEKIVQVRTVEERLVEVPVQREIAIIQQVPKPYKEIQEVFIKGDKQEIIVEVEKIIEKPLIHEILKVVQVQRERLVPVIVQQDRPIIVQIKQPYIQNQIQIVSCEIEKVVPYKQQIPIEILKQVPVAVVCEKEVIKPTRVIVEKIIEKIVEVPRVVEVEKIVEKIVIVPRVIENIVLVPQIVEKIVEREVEVLKIIEIEKPVPYYINKEILEIVQERVEMPVERVVYNTVEKEKIVVTNTQTEVIKQVEVERKIPYEVIREKQVPFMTEKIVEKIVSLNSVEIKQKEVVIPFRHEVPIEIIHQKGVEIKKIIDNVVQVPQIVTRNTVLYETVNVPEIHQIIVQKPIEIIKEVIYTNTVNHIEIKPQYKELIKQVLVKQTEKLEILKPQPYYVEKIVVVTNVEQQAVEVKVEKGVPYRVDNILVVEKPVPIPVIQEIPKVVNVDKIVEIRTIHESLKQVPIEGREKTVILQTVKPEIVEITKQVIKVLIEHQEKDVLQQVALVHQNTQIVQIPTKPLVVHEVKQIYRDVYEPLLLEKVIERVTLLPQIVEVLKHIHEISEERIEGIGLGIAGVGIDVEVHTSNYVELCINLRKGLENLLLSLRNAKSAEVKAQVTLIEELVLVLGDLIRFPNIIQIPKLIQKIVEVEKPVVVPTKDNKSVLREIAANTLIEKLLVELKRVRSSGVEIKLDNEILNTFFVDFKGVESLNDKIGEMGSSMLNRFRTLGEWTHQNTIMLNNFLEEKFLLSNIVRESNRSIERLKEKLENSEVNRLKLDDAVTRLNILNLSLKNSLNEVVESLNRSRRNETVDRGEIDLILTRINTTISLIDNQQTTSLSQRISTTYDNSSLKRKLSQLQKQLQSYRGGEIQRSRYVNDQNIELKDELQTTKLQVSRLKTLLAEINLGENSRDRVVSSSRVEDLNNLLTEQKLEYDRAVQKLREEFVKRQNERTVETRVITSTIDRSQQEQRQRQVITKLQLRIRDLENELVDTKNRESRITVDLQRRGLEYQDLRRKLTERQTRISELDRTTTHHAEDERLRFTIIDLESKIKDLKDQLGRSTVDLHKSNDNASKFRSNLEKSEFEQSRLMTELKRKNQEVEGMRTKLAESQVYRTAQKGSNFSERKPGIEDQFTSPDIKNVTTGNNPDTPAAQFTNISSPDVQEFQFSESSGTEKKSLGNVEYKNLQLNELMRQGVAIDENISSKIIIKICERIQANIMIKLYLFYTLSNIKLVNYSPDDLDKLTIEFGAPIKLKDATEVDKKYLPPEALRGLQLSEKSCVFNIGIIWDEMLHGETFYKDSDEILEQNIEYKVRNIRMNPIFKNMLFEMILRDPVKRQDFNEIKRRLSLQRYITTDAKKKS